MITIKGNKFVYFDVDDTLVDWNRRETEHSLVFENSPNSYWSLEPKWEIVRKIREHKRAGDTVIVWSQGGSGWAEEVVKTLNLEDYVDLILTKPHIYYDDLHCNEWLKDWVKVK